MLISDFVLMHGVKSTELHSAPVVFSVFYLYLHTRSHVLYFRLW